MMNKNILTINKANGALSINNYPITLQKGSRIEQVSKILTQLYRSNIDYKNGNQWMFFGDIEFCECPCKLGLYFEQEALTQVKLTITPIHADHSKSGWASDQTIDEAVMLTRFELKLQLNRPFIEGKESFNWGQVWVLPDYAKSEMDAGIRFK